MKTVKLRKYKLNEEESLRKDLYRENRNKRKPTEDERNFRNGYGLIWDGIECLEKVNLDNLMDLHGDTPREIRLQQSIGQSEAYRIKDDIREIKRIVSKWGRYMNTILPLFRVYNGDGTFSWTE